MCVSLQEGASSLFIKHRDDFKLQPCAYATTELAVEEARPVRDPKTGHTTEEHVYWQSPSGCASRSKRRQYAFEEKRQAKICGKLSDPYTRVACDIRKQLMAMEKKEKKRPRMATALSGGAEKVVARSFGTSEDARQPLDHEVATPASFGNLAARDAALARSEAQSPAGGGASSALGILSPAGRHLLLAERVKPDGHRSPNPHKSPEGVVVPTLSPDYASPLGITKR
ncbi:hypothetical protein HPB51_028883 [Rhipicephalus microplus]|uniref:Uncharacterized protein n=1 Tax=Rhipicephalus microplus TaxID=6941 RepID=A0A9J6CVP1_RHIMP|nr:hypothetical protein HPB51_028883 [Rhipicephalus microplus]